MARKPASHFEIVALDQAVPRIDPPSHLDGVEKALFHSIVQAASPQHFTRNDAQLLGAYCQACQLVAQSYASAIEKPDYVRDWEKAVRVMINLARQLRLTTRSRVDPKSLTRELTGRSYHQTGVSLEGLDAAREGSGRGWKAKG
jgi:phage terminase small subunit